jgi:hypothetical protein
MGGGEATKTVVGREKRGGGSGGRVIVPGLSMLSPDSSKVLAENSPVRLVAMSWR